MAWVKFKGKVPLNTQTISYLNEVKGRTIVCMGASTVTIEESLEDAKDMIDKAEQAEREAMFKENKDEIVSAVAEKIYAMMNDALHFDKPTPKPPVNLKSRAK